ncbi:MAG TPA: hydrogenase maturation protease [Syntrophobacteraceae bacterium]|nr:hydrogenase maturation protease [Syntrophobacteraceae bacterium]
MKIEKQPSRTLVIGYGNIDRADDGIAFWVVNALRERLHQKKLSEGNTGLEELGQEVDSIFLVQLAPELTDVLPDYRQVIFVDSHVYEGIDNLYCTPVSAQFTPSTFTHHMTPTMLLALLKLLNQPEPFGHLVSIRGYDFDFHRGLSADTRSLVNPAVDYILHLVNSLPPGASE